MHPTSRQRHVLILLVVLIFVAAWLRLWRLTELPPGVWYDEAYYAMDALWILETRSPQVFFIGNNGREPLWQYLAAISMAVLGVRPYAFRLVSVLVGIVTLPLMYRWLVTLFFPDPNRSWLALIATTGYAFSFWQVMMSRTGYRVTVFPPFVILTAYLFWRGWQRR